MIDRSGLQTDGVDGDSSRLTLFTRAVHRALTGIHSLGGTGVSHTCFVPRPLSSTHQEYDALGACE